jgi:Asp-tRNA(Asn)/Glu-tRNA(Gln) amidotransferase A subunit family amidase
VAGPADARSLDAAEAAQALARAEGSTLGAFWTLDRNGALLSADGRGAGERDPLAGAIVAVKDCFDVAGLPTTCGVARDWPAAIADAEAVRRLRRAGAVPLGKASMDQLAWSTFALAPGFPPCRNPIDPELTPGGSSCGSAAAVAGGLASLGLGTDDAGSIRIPAACCGVVGLMPPRDWIPLAGAAGFAPSFDSGGVVARSLGECVAAVEVLAERRIAAAPVRGARIGLLEGQLELADAAVVSAVEAAAEALAGAGAELVPARLDPQPPAGMGKMLAAELERTWGDEVRRAPELYDEEVRTSITYAERLSPLGYTRARDELDEARRALESALEGCTAVLGPTMYWPAPPAESPRSVAEMTACTRPFNALGWTALSVPSRPAEPIGIQLAAPPAGFGVLVSLAGVLSD